MEIEVEALVLNDLIDKNIPFVIFREPGNEANCLIQNSPLNHASDLAINKRGFYLFPFSPQEKSSPLYFRPDFLFPWNSFHDQKIDLNELEAPEIRNQKLIPIDKAEYISDLERYLTAFENQGIQKAIYSRVRKEDLHERIDIEAFVNKLMDRYKRTFVYALHIPGDGIWIGASPELLLSFNNSIAKTVALAGTLKVKPNVPAPEWTRKEIDEHRLVEKYIIALCDEQNIPFLKSKVRSTNTGKVYHLKSDFELEIESDEIVEFLKKLHPTPAISGLPQDLSLELIYETENHERSYYCGYLGWVNDINEFNLFINLRCMKLIDKRYFLFAGGGITPDSNIHLEWEETQLKMATLQDLLPERHNLSIQ